MKVLIILVALLLMVEATAQDNDSLRSQYVQRFPDYFFLWPVIKQKQLTFSVGDKGGKHQYEYSPNNAFTAGFGAYLFDLAFEITFAISPNQKKEIQYGRSDARDFQINALAKNWGVDFFNQRYSGYYLDDLNFANNNNGVYQQRGDIVAKNFGITGLYIFNANKYSIKSFLNFSERQIKRGGSFLISGTVGSFRVAGDSAILDPTIQSRLGDGASFTKLRNTTLSIAPGYAYNYVFKKQFFLSGALSIGPAHNWILYESEGKAPKNDIKINTFVSFRLGLGYNGARWFGGFSFLTQNRTVRFEDMSVTSASSTFRMLVGYRFKEFGFLKKSVWDLPKELSLGVSK